MKILGLIPARGGSKRIPGKNLAEIGGKSLIEIAVAGAVQALEGGFINAVWVSTEDAAIAAAAKRASAKAAVITRPIDYARDDTPSVVVVQHALQIAEFGRHHFDAVMLLQPTSPFRCATDIEVCAMMMRSAESIISVERGMAEPNGAIFCAGIEMIENGALYNRQSGTYAMPAHRSLDIDTDADLAMARRIYEHGPQAAY